jgi:selenide,water dikinase
MQREVILVGGGHSHVQVLESLASQPLDGATVTVVVDRPVAIYSGMVPGFVAGQYKASELEIDVPQLCQWAGVECIVDLVRRLDADARRILTQEGRELSYDLASVNIGSTVAGLELPGVREHAIPTRPIAELIRRTDEVVDRACHREGSSPFRVVVVGGGAGGVELAFTFLQRLQDSGCGAIEIHLINAGPRILQGYPPALARRAHKAAEKRGIQIHCGLRVQSTELGRITLDNGEEWPCDALLWVTGATSHGLLRDSGLPVEERGFVQTRSTLQVLDHDELFAVGDCGTLIDFPRTPKAGVYAVRQGPILTHNLRASLADKTLRPYLPQSDFLTLLNLGDGTALGAKKGMAFQGRWVMWLKDRIDRAFMQRFQAPFASR